MKRKNTSDSSSGSGSGHTSRIKPKALANGQLRCPNGTRRKGKYCVPNEKKKIGVIVENEKSPEGLKPDNKLLKIDGDGFQDEPKRLVIRVPKEQPENKRITIKVPRNKPAAPPLVQDVPLVQDIPLVKNDVPLVPPSLVQRVASPPLQEPKDALQEPKDALQEPKELGPNGAVKPLVLGNGKLRCPDGTRRTKDGHWCVSKEHYNVPYIREIIDEVAKKTQNEAKSSTTTPHAIIVDSNLKTPIQLEKEEEESSSEFTFAKPKPIYGLNQTTEPIDNIQYKFASPVSASDIEPQNYPKTPIQSSSEFTFAKPKPIYGLNQTTEPIDNIHYKFASPASDIEPQNPTYNNSIRGEEIVFQPQTTKGEMAYKPMTNFWDKPIDKIKCPNCYVMNDKNVIKCVSCEFPLNATTSNATPFNATAAASVPSGWTTFAPAPAAGTIGSKGFIFSNVNANTNANANANATTEIEADVPLVDSLISSSSQKVSSSIPIESYEPQTQQQIEVVGVGKEYKRLNLLKREKERAENPTESPFLLPTLNDPKFSERIAAHKAFADTPYDGTIHDIEKRANEMCQVEFGLMPHQSFVRNFMSAETPYNTLLLFHSLGSGKTCSAISVCEEMRTYMKQSGLREKIIVIASPNVQGNFRKQLFDESRLEKIILNTDPEEYTWNIQSCVGNSLLREINPGLIRNFPKEKIVSNIQSLINTYYTFMGYGQFANYVLELSGTSAQYEIANIRRHFNNRLIVIDEVQNIRMTEENTNKEATAAAAVLLKVVKYTDNMRMLLLTATPMYNSYKEIIWLTNLMNSNDKRSTIEVKDIFDADGNIKTEKSGESDESGMELLRRKLTGYVSYVRGENPYAFPFRIYPEHFAPEHALSSLAEYPKEQMNGKPITDPMTKMPVYLNRLSRTSLQYSVYSSIINELAIGKDVYTATGKLKNQLAFDDMDAFGYTVLQKPIEALNITYPDVTGATPGLVGSAGLQSVVTYNHTTKTDFEYLPNAEGRIFSPEHIRNYSVKIAEIGERIRESEGIVIVYSQYIEGGIIPLALAMEELGISRYASTPTTKSLFKPSNSPQVEPLLTASGKPAKYIMITGDRMYSPANNADMKIVSSGENKDGDLIKVVLISRAGAEGLDFANVRQLHIMEPWYNMSRMEQIIGRAVRNLSHCKLPFNKRNVQIFLHGTIIEAETETADMYIYRLVEKKMHLIQNVERVMKESAVDCLIHIGQNNYTKSALSKEPKNVDIPILLSNGKTIKFTPGDEEDAVYECKSSSGETLSVPTITDEGKSTYSDSMARTNMQYIGDRIRQLFRESSSWSRTQLEKAVSAKKKVPIEQLFYTLSQFVGNKHNYVIDRYGRFGYIVNNDKYYVFQPMELTDQSISVYERSVPVEYKRKTVSLEVSPEFGKTQMAVSTAAVDAGTMNNETRVEESKALQELEDLFIAATDKNEIKKSKDWYIHAGHVFEHLEQVHFMSLDTQYNYFTHHFFDLMEFSDKESLVKSLFPPSEGINKNDLSARAMKSYRTSTPGETITIKDRALTYFAKRMLFNEKRNDVVCVLSNKNDLVIMKRSVETGSPWKIGDRADLDYFAAEMNARIVVNKHSLFPIIGFSGDFKGKETVFKVKDLTQKRNNVGAKIESAGKVDIIKYTNQLLGHEQYTQENTDTAKGGITQLGMCVILEFLMRDFTEQKKGGRVYYLGPEQAIELDITRI